MMNHQRYVLNVAALLALLSPSSHCFITSVLRPSRRDVISFVSSEKVPPIKKSSTTTSLFVSFYHDGSTDDIEEDWRMLTEAANNIARKVGGNVLNSIGDSLKDTAKKSNNRKQQYQYHQSEEVSNSSPPFYEQAYQNPGQNMHTNNYGTAEQQQYSYQTSGQNMYNSNSYGSSEQQYSYQNARPNVHAANNFGYGQQQQAVNPNFGSTTTTYHNPNPNRGVQVNDFTSNMGASVAVDAAVNEAYKVLKADSTASALLGNEFELGRKLHNLETPTVQGNSIVSIIEASFEVFGEYARGVATVVSTDNELMSLEMTVNGQLYVFDTNTPQSSGNHNHFGMHDHQDANPYEAGPTSYTHHYDNGSARTYTPRNNNNGGEVEVEFVDKPSSPSSSTSKHNVMDAEILD